MLNHILAGFWTCLQPLNFFTITIGVILGIIVGAIPGINDTLLISLLSPVIMFLPSVQGFLILVAIYCAGIYGGSISAILFRIPGTPAASATVFDGYELTKKGQAGKALGTAIICSAIGGLFSVIVLMTISPTLAKVALQFGPPEYFSLSCLGLSIVSTLTSKSLMKGTISVLLGLFLATIGMDPMLGVARFNFGTNFLLSGIQFIPAIIGLFAINEIFYQTVKREKIVMKIENLKIFTQLLSLRELKALFVTIIKSCGIGTLIGALPGAGATIAAFLSYGEAVRSSKHPEKFGTGILEGVAAPETANNASTGGALIPLFSLGIPGSSTGAIFLTILIIKGLKPGPLMFLQQSQFVYAIFVGMIFANIIMVPFGLFFINAFIRLFQIPEEFLYPAIFLIATMGSFALRSNMLDVWVMLGMGILGYFMRKHGFPEAPLILGLILGPLVEINFRTTLLMFENHYVFFTRPVSGIILTFSIFAFLFPFAKSLFSKKNVRVIS